MTGTNRERAALESGLREQVDLMQKILDETRSMLIKLSEVPNNANSSTAEVVSTTSAAKVAETRAAQPWSAKDCSQPSEPKGPEEGQSGQLQTSIAAVVVQSDPDNDEDIDTPQEDLKYIARKMSDLERGVSMHDLRTELEKIAKDVAVELGITAEEVLKAYHYFCESDKDRSGKLDLSELHGLLEKLCGHNISQREVEKILSEFDTDTDGFVSFEEFLFCYCHTPDKKMKHLAEFVNCKRGKLSPEFRAHISGVRTTHLKAYVQEEIREMNACLTLPIMLMLFASFSCAALIHWNTYVIFGMEHAFQHDIEENANFAFSGIIPFENGRMGHKNIYDVNTYADFWSWFSIGLVPLLFPESWDVSEQAANIGASCTAPANAMSSFGWELNQTLSGLFPSSASLAGNFGSLCSQLESPTPPKDFFKKPPYLFFNSIVAGLRLSQEQLPLTRCLQTSLYKAAYDTACVEDPGHWTQPEMDEAIGLDKALVNQPGGETHFLLSQKKQSGIRQELKALEKSAWLNQRTARIEILYTTYNAHKDVFTALYIYFMINRGGQIHKFIKPVSLSMSPYENPASYVFETIFVLLVFKILIEEGQELGGLCYRKGFKTGILHYFSTPAQVVDWTSIVTSFAIFGMWGRYLYMISDLRAVLGTGDTNVVGTFGDDGQRAAFFELVDSITDYANTFRVTLAFYPFVLGLRFFLAFGGQPRLALVTNTLKSAAVDVVHFGVVMFTLMAVFSVSAQILYGQDLDEFATFDRALMSVFRGILGDIDYNAWIKVGRQEVSFWFVCFNVLLQLLMLNMLLAIIFDIYSAVKSAVPESAETFWSQSYEIFDRWNKKRKGERISLPAVLVSLEACQADYVNVMTFQSVVENLSRTQAEKLLREADEYSSGLAPDDEEHEHHKRVRHIDMRTQHVQLVATEIQKNAVLASVRDSAHVYTCNF